MLGGVQDLPASLACVREKVGHVSNRFHTLPSAEASGFVFPLPTPPSAVTVRTLSFLDHLGFGKEQANSLQEGKLGKSCVLV